MFQVGRFDPKQEERDKRKAAAPLATKEKRKKKKKHDKEEAEDTHDSQKDDHADEETTLRVIAPETSGASSTDKQLNTKLAEEAFDDLDITEELIQDNVKEDGDETIDPTDEIQTALYMSKQAIHEAAAGWGLAPFLVENLKKDGYKNFFPIQSLVIPDVIAAERHAHIRARDICVAAPTGSGKTLAFVIPVLNALANRQIRRLRALVVLPSRDLAKQVFDVFEHYSEGSDLKIGLAVGQSDFLAEQKALTVDHIDSKSSMSRLSKLRYSFDPGNVGLALDAFDDDDGIDLKLPMGGISAIDVLVCTPGRLVDHLDNTPGFSLQHLRFLVIDEADRLLSQSYHGWIGRVVDSANSASVAAWHAMQKEASKKQQSGGLTESADGCSYVLDPITWRRGGTMGDEAGASVTATDTRSSVVSSVCRPVQLRKLLYSATMTKDPQKLAALRLVNPKHFDAHHLAGNANSNSNSNSNRLYSMPEKLKEYTVECTAEQKPIVLLALLLEQLEQNTSSRKSIIVVFTSSLESTHRLARLLQLLWGSAGYGDPSLVAEFSSALNQTQRSHLMTRCNDPADLLSVVVCSDGMSRGMDIEFVGTVINYDVPGFAKTYVHRCGRTARAGKEGVAISLLKGGQVGQFSKMRRLMDHPDKVASMGVKKTLVRDAVPLYRSCVATLKKILEAEEHGKLNSVDNNLEAWLPSQS